MQFATESLYDVMGEVAPLLCEHWEQIALDKDTVKLSPDWDVYKFMQDHDKLHITTVRQEGELVGYVVYLISRSLHYVDEVFAEGDLFWLSPQHRKGSAGLKMFKHAEAALRGKGVTKVINKVKLHFDVGKIFERMGYQPIERVYAKGLR
ncbi:MAG: hypothetical protein Unbinned3065contig1002_6 [Prokaryotic dsDNA virus sp.]|nr:MAG: hypothetical protein Unbinned3065contig1002_6 [Prokaryotic dsDNA virus sp.]|tara:strand:- start:449 stop:898 length:450 start_codon:yes stop_codon:yes gene_type:complete